MGALGEQGLYNHMMQQIAGGLDMPVHNSIAYQSLAKYTPRDIAEWLHTDGGMVGQNAAVNAVASVLYSHWHYPLRPKRNLLLIGSTGCGKSELMRSVQRFALANLGAHHSADFVRTVDCTQLNASGWKGGVKLGDVLRGVSMPNGCVLFLDEFDKACSERYAGGSSGGSWSVSDLIQEQLLTTLDHQIIQLSGDDGKPFTVDTQKITVICMGAFTALREKKRLQAERRSIGFSSAASSAAETVSEITVEDLDLADFGMMPEIYGRLTPLLMDEVSPAMMLQIAEQTVKTLCDTTELHITVPENKLRILSEEAFASGQGGRGIMKRLQAALDEHIFEDPCRDMYVL